MRNYQAQKSNRKVGDICNYWNKLVIIHKVDNTAGWAEVLKIINPNKPLQASGEPFSVRTSQLSLVQASEEASI